MALAVPTRATWVIRRRDPCDLQLASTGQVREGGHVTEGLQLMMVGMTTVFAFLALLVLLMGGAARFFSAYAHLFPDDPEPPPARSNEQSDAEIAVVLAAAEAWRRSQPPGGRG